MELTTDAFYEGLPFLNPHYVSFVILMFDELWHYSIVSFSLLPGVHVRLFIEGAGRMRR